MWDTGNGSVPEHPLYSLQGATSEYPPEVGGPGLILSQLRGRAVLPGGTLAWPVFPGALPGQLPRELEGPGGHPGHQDRIHAWLYPGARQPSQPVGLKSCQGCAVGFCCWEEEGVPREAVERSGLQRWQLPVSPALQNGLSPPALPPHTTNVVVFGQCGGRPWFPRPVGRALLRGEPSPGFLGSCGQCAQGLLFSQGSGCCLGRSPTCPPGAQAPRESRSRVKVRAHKRAHGCCSEIDRCVGPHRAEGLTRDL